MRPAWIVFLFVVFLTPSFSPAASPGDLSISFIQGDVQIKPADTDEWVPAAVNTPLLEGDVVWVPEDGRGEIRLIDGTYVRLDGNSSLEILTAQRDAFQFHLSLGRAYINFKGLHNSVLQMDTPFSSIRVYDRSKFRVDVSDSGDTEVSVFRGLVYGENRAGRISVSAGEALSIDENSAGLSELGPVDEWEQWNAERDGRGIEVNYSAGYLPDPLQVYSDDFDAYGRWVDAGDYGYCWAPTVDVSDWAPYRIGRWVWIGGDYVWISYEPWGWVPYHYGRWIFDVSVGWCWVPPSIDDLYWGPGYVGWVYTPYDVSWCPLAPKEIYYGYGYFGPYSVNILNININNVVIKKAYRNANAKNAVTSISRTTFVTGTPEKVRITGNPFLKERIGVGRPPIKPVRTSFMPVIKAIPRVAQPPQTIRQVDVRNLKAMRPLVKERNQSVFRPGAPPKEMPLIRIEERKAPGPGRIEKPEERRVPVEKGVEKPEQRKAPMERRIERPEDQRAPVGRGMERPEERKAPVERAVPEERRAPIERKVPVERVLERPQEQRAPVERRIESPQERKAPADSEKKIERREEQPAPAERGTERHEERMPVERGIERLR
jgi:hypothetical protein